MNNNSKPSFLGSTIAVIVGAICLAVGLTQPGDILVIGVAALFGALAYKSAKKRMLGLVPSSTLRKSLEIVAIMLVLAAVLLQNNLGTRLYENPAANILAPLWAVIAYIVAIRRNADFKLQGRNES